MDNIKQIKLHKMGLECQSFYMASQLLWNDYFSSKENFEKLYPCVVNSAFACELALKSILIKFDIPYSNTHYLYTLITKVSDDFLDIVVDGLQAIYYPDREKTQLTDAIKAVSDIFRKYRYISDYSVVVEYRFVKNLSDFLFWCEQKLCGKIQMTCLGTLTDESEIEKIDKKLSDTFISQIIDAKKNAKK
jgi:hypothetical protein